MHQDTRGRDQIFLQIINNKKTIEEICIGCGSLQVITQHPLFEGGLCDPCKDNFLETMFLYDQDGYQSFCTICCGGTKVLMCGNSGCKRCYCCECLDALVKPGAAKQAEAMEPWVCFMCCPVQSFGLLRKKKTWQLKLKQFFDQESDHVRIYAPVPTDKQNPIRVLSIFSNMTKDLQDIGILDRVHKANHETLTFLKDLDNVTRQNVEQKGPFDFVIGVCQQNSSVHHHSGRIIFQYYRILQYAKPKEADERPFFWIFVDPEILTQDDIKDASRFLECDPVIIHDFCESAVRLWSNIPSLKSFNTVQQINVSVQTLRRGIHHNSCSPPAWFHPLPALIGCFGDCSALCIAVIGPASCKSWIVKFAADMYDPAWENRSQNSGETCMKMVKQFLVPLKDYFKSYL